MYTKSQTREKDESVITKTITLTIMWKIKIGMLTHIKLNVKNRRSFQEKLLSWLPHWKNRLIFEI